MSRTHRAELRFKRGPIMDVPGPGDEYKPNKLIEEYGWIMVEIDEINRFQAAYWVYENCGEEYVDYVYEPKNKWLFRNHEAASMFKLSFA